MKQKSGPDKTLAERVLKDIRRQTRRQYPALLEHTLLEKLSIFVFNIRG
jgi:hypothetical protein